MRTVTPMAISSNRFRGDFRTPVNRLDDIKTLHRDSNKVELKF